MTKQEKSGEDSCGTARDDSQDRKSDFASEIAAIGIVLGTLKDLTKAGQCRVLNYAIDHLDLYIGRVSK